MSRARAAIIRDAGYAEDRDISIGVNGAGFGRSRRFQSPNSIPFVKRNSPTMLNVGFNGVDQTGGTRRRPRRCSGTCA